MAASSGHAAQSFGDVLYRAGEDSCADDIWDDTALIEAYDRAVNLVKNGGENKGKGGGKNRKQQNAKGNGHKKKEKRKTEQNVDSSEQWQVGDSCSAEFTEDGEIYGAAIVSIDREKQTCIVRYDDYGNEEEQNLKSLIHSKKSEVLPDQGYYAVDSPYYAPRPNTTIQTDMDWSSQTSTHSTGHHWSISNICLAPEYPSGHLHEAVINLFPTAYTCQVTFIRSKRSQQVNKSQLCETREHHHHQHNPFTPPLPGFLQQNMAWPPPPPPVSNFPNPAFPTLPNHTFPHGMPIFGHVHQHPPTPPIPPVPPHPLTTSGGQDNEALASMLMSWYLSGYYTGYYQGQQRKQPHQTDGQQTQPDTTNTSINNTQTSASVTQDVKQN